MSLWYVQDYLDHYQMSLEVKESLFMGKSEFQEIMVIETYLYGKALLLDGIVQTTEKDEFMYHEMLVHPAMVTCLSPSKVLIVGGGDGGASREVLKHPVDKVVLVDIDQQVIEICQKFFPQLGKWDDSRLEVIIGDAATFLTTTQDTFDVIIMDSTDPLPAHVAEPLFTQDFFDLAYERLAPGGVLVSQMEPPFFQPERVAELWKRLKSFPLVYLYWGLVPTYPGGVWNYVVASKKNNPTLPRKKLPFTTRYYSDSIHQAAFVLPPFLQVLVEKANR